MRRLQSVSVSINRTVQRFWKELDVSNGDYDSTVAREPHFDRSDEKRTPEFVVDIKAMIDNDLSELSDLYLWAWENLNFLIKQVVLEEIRYFSFKMRNGQFSSKAMKDTRKDRAAKLLNKLKHYFQPKYFEFSNMRKISARIRSWIHRITFVSAISLQVVPIVMKTKHLVNFIVFRGGGH